MSEKLVCYKTAQLAKNKGFEERVHNWFDDNEYNHKAGLTSEDDPIFNEDLTRQINIYAKKFKINDVARPTQVQLKTWLREKHYIFIEILTDCTTEPKFCYKIHKFIGNPKDLSEREWDWYHHEIFDWHLYYEYEGALEDALLDGLTLID